MYEDSVTTVRCAVGITEGFKVEFGLHQELTLKSFPVRDDDEQDD